MSRTGSLDCQSFEDRIQKILDDRLLLTGDDLLMAHAARCAKCEKILNDYDSVDDSVKLLPADLARILAAADAKRASTSFASRHLILLASLAALIVISLNIFQRLDSEQPNRTSFAQAPASPHFAFVSPGASKRESPVSRQSPQRFRLTPDSSPFSHNFSVVELTPSINLPTIPTWHDISSSLDSLGPVWTYSFKIPVVRRMHGSLNATFNFLKQSFSKSERKPDLGFWIESNMLTAV